MMNKKRVNKQLFTCLLVPLATSAVGASEPPRSITVVGQGSATAPPDMATFHTAVVTQAATAADALKTNNEAVARILTILKTLDVADKDVQTSRFDISPMYDRNMGHSDPRKRDPIISGYQVTNQVHVVVRDLPSLGKILDDVVQAGSNQIGGISFDIDNKVGVLNQARSGAIRDAQARAALYAQAGDVKLGRILNIQETGAAAPQPRMMMRMAAAESSVPIATGEQELSATVTVTFELDD